MSDQPQKSTWMGESTINDWYGGSVALKGPDQSNPTEKTANVDPIFSRDLDNCFDYSGGTFHHWFYDAANGAETKMSNAAHYSSRTLAMSIPRGCDGRLSTEKPLPGVPCSPYFDYLFANAAVEPIESHRVSVQSDCGFGPDGNFGTAPLGDSIEDEASPADNQLFTPKYVMDEPCYDSIDDSVFVQQDFPQASFQIIDKDVVKKHAMLQSTNLATICTFGQKDEIEKADLTVGFYYDFATEESTGPYYAPNSGHEGGFGEIRDGAEAPLEQWTNNEQQPGAKSLAEIGAVTREDKRETVIAATRKILKPTTQKAKAAKTPTDRLLLADFHPGTKKALRTTQFSMSGHATGNGKKRSADKLFWTNSSTDIGKNENDENGLRDLYAKKMRRSCDASMDTEVVFAPMPSPCHHFSASGGERNHLSYTSIAATSVFGKAKNLAPTEEGFPGQFMALQLPERGFHPKFLAYTTMKHKQRFTMGDLLHPNHLFTHVKFRRCSNEYNLDYNKADAHPFSEVGRALHRAESLAILAADVPKTDAQENLRREIHLECTHARLEGVSVGKYRYYQGHSSIEEYNLGGMCICWDACFCNKMCTRYPDMLCPCAEYIELGND